MRRWIFCAAWLPALAAGTLLAGEPTLPPAKPEAPFARTTAQAAAKTFTPVMTDAGVVSGNKKIELKEDGSLIFSASGRVVGKVILGCKTKGDNGADEWFVNSSRKYFEPAASVERNGETLKVEVKYLWGARPDAMLRQRLTLREDGLVLAEWDPLPEPKRPTTEILHMMLQRDAIDNGSIILNGKKIDVPPPTTGCKSMLKGMEKPSMLEILPDDPSKKILVRGEKCDSVMLYNTDAVRADFLNKNLKGGVSLLFDMRDGVAHEAARTDAGLDWKELDNLTLPDYRVCRNLMPNSSFEQTSSPFFSLLRYQGFAADKAKRDSGGSVIDGSTAKFGGHSLKIPIFSDERNFPRNVCEAGNTTSMPIPLDVGEYVFSFHARADAPGRTVTCWSPGSNLHGSDHWISIGHVVAELDTEWKRHSFKVELKKPDIFRVAFNAVSPDRKGAVWVDGLQLEKAGAATEYTPRPVETSLLTSDPANILEEGAPVNARIRVSTPEGGKSGSVKVSIRDIYDSEIYAASFKFATDSKGNAEIPLGLDGRLPLGTYAVRADLSMSDELRTYDFHRVTRMPFVTAPYKHRFLYSPAYSILENLPNVHKVLGLLQKTGFGSRGYMHANTRENFELLKKYGFEISHDMIEVDEVPEGSTKRYYSIRKEHNWPKNADYFRNSTVMIEDYRLNNPSGELTEDYLRRFEDVVGTYVKARPWIRTWAFSGEADARWPEWAGIPASDKEFSNYIRLCESFVKGVKKADSSLKVMNDCPCNMNQAGGIYLIDRILKASRGRFKYDIIDCHTYRVSPDNPDFDADIAALVEVMRRNGYEDTPIYFTEGIQSGNFQIPQWQIEMGSWNTRNEWVYNNPSYDIGWNEKLSAAHHMRFWLTCLKHKQVKHQTSNIFSNSLALDLNLTPNLQLKAVNTLASLLGDCEFKSDIRFAPGARALLFDDGKGRPVAAVWSSEKRIDAGFAGPIVAEADFGGTPPECFDMMQARRSLESAGSGKTRFAVSGFPIFLRGERGGLAAMETALKSLRPVSGVLAPIFIDVRPLSPSSMSVLVKNRLASPYSGRVEWNGGAADFDIPGNSEKSFELPLPVPLAAGKIARENIALKLISHGESSSVAADFEGTLCPRLPSAPTPGGRSPLWDRIPKVALDKTLAKCGPENLSGFFQAGWCEDGLGIRVTVRDDKFVHVAKDDKSRWDNDSLQIYFDPLLDGRKTGKRGYGRDDYEYAVLPSPDGKGAATYRAVIADMQLSLGTSTPKPMSYANDIPSAFELTGDGYVYEVFFPAKYLLPLKLQPEAAFGFGLFVNDRDDESPKGGSSNGLTLSADGGGCFNKPHLWPVMMLGK